MLYDYVRSRNESGGGRNIFGWEVGGLQRRRKLQTAALLAGKVEVRWYVGVKRGATARTRCWEELSNKTVQRKTEENRLIQINFHWLYWKLHKRCFMTLWEEKQTENHFNISLSRGLFFNYCMAQCGSSLLYYAHLSLIKIHCYLRYYTLEIDPMLELLLCSYHHSHKWGTLEQLTAS